MAKRRTTGGAVLALVFGLVVAQVSYAQDTLTYTNADFERLSQPTSGQVLTNADLGKLPRPDNSLLPVLEEEGQDQTERAAPSELAETVTTTFDEDLAQWLSRTLTRLDRQRRYDELQRRIRTLTDRLEVLEGSLGRAPGDVASARMVDTYDLVSRGVADTETPRLTERRRVGSELQRSRVELEELLSESDN